MLPNWGGGAPIKILVIGLVLLPQTLFAQIDEFKNKFVTARVYADTPSYSVDLKNKIVSGAHVDWHPNLRSLTGVDLSFPWFIAVGYSWANNDDPGSAQKKGVTEFSDYRVTYTPRRFRIEANYQRYRGFYIDNTTDIVPTYPAGFHILDPTMVGGNISVNATMVMSPDNFTYTGVIGQDARQATSGGSWLLGLTLNDTYFSSDNFLIPSQVRSTYGQDQNAISLHFYSVSAKGGYGYTFMFTKAWYLSLVLNLGFGGEYRTVKDTAGTTSTTGGTGKADGVISFGYNGDDFLIAFIVTGDSTTFSTSSLEIPATLGDAKLAIGYRF